MPVTINNNNNNRTETLENRGETQLPTYEDIVREEEMPPPYEKAVPTNCVKI
jgi:hypothetical protein